MGNEPVGDLLNSIISDALPKLVEAIYKEVTKPPLYAIVMEVLTYFINCAKSHVSNISYCFTLPDLELVLSEIKKSFRKK